NTFGVQSFYLNDIIEFKTKDDEKTIAHYSGLGAVQFFPRATSHSTNEVYTEIRFRNQSVLKLQVFRATGDNISRATQNHVNLYNYACQLSQILYQYATYK
ncbi:MAG: hypothetical protein IKV35_07165, partial [Clostridia bacterium]|nr:hypothetical protein [Clostridia bacterium]